MNRCAPCGDSSLGCVGTEVPPVNDYFLSNTGFIMSFIDLEITDVRNETPELVHLALRGGDREFHAAYHTPGQYVQAQPGTPKPGFFAIACAPGGGGLELLVKRGNPISDAITAKMRGEKLSVSAPQGKGYPLAQALGRDIFVVGVGSGMAPLRALMQTILKQRAAYGRVAFIYGARCPESFPYPSEVNAWPSQGVEVPQVCSRPAAGAWSGNVGRVQQVLQARQAPVDPSSTVFVCGMKPMVEDVSAAFARLGLGAEHIFQNY